MRIERGENPSCRELDAELFFIPPEHLDGKTRSTLTALCNGCDIRSKCFQWALVHEEYGFWAGTTPADRRRLRRQFDIKPEFITLPAVIKESAGKVETGWCEVHYMPTYHRGRVNGAAVRQCDACWKKTEERINAKSKQEA